MAIGDAARRRREFEEEEREKRERGQKIPELKRCSDCNGYGYCGTNKYGGNCSCSKCSGTGYVVKKKNGCFISTACVGAAGLDDKCKELETLRQYRDNWLRKTETGENLIRDYYERAPRIVDAIERRSDASDVFGEIFRDLVQPTAAMIKQGRFGEARDHYCSYVKRLEDRFLEK